MGREMNEISAIIKELRDAWEGVPKVSLLHSTVQPLQESNASSRVTTGYHKPNQAVILTVAAMQGEVSGTWCSDGIMVSDGSP